MKNDTFTYTNHALERAASRGITKQMIEDTVHHGTCMYRQGIRFYILLEKNRPRDMLPHYLSQLVNTVVLLSENNEVITVYKNKAAFKNIRHKPKRLL